MPSAAAAAWLAAAAARASAALERAGVAPLPRVRGVAWGVLARWYARVSAGESWRPLVLVEPASLGAPVWVDQLELAQRGFIGVPSGRLPEAFSELARDAGVALLVPDASELADAPAGGSEPPEGLATWLTHHDRLHAVATDPSQRDTRRSLLAHCRGNATVHLVGPAGTGKRALAAWAHASLDDRPLAVVARGGSRQPPAGRWVRFDEVGELEPDQIVHLRAALRAADPPDAAWQAPTARLPRPHHPALGRILGRSPALARVLTDLLRVAPLAMPVLILGESGVGKESLARAVHDASGRRGPYRALDLSTINDQLVESELFGHVRGAFTGADRERLGAFRQATGGTLFLDELGNLSPRVQAKLLRVLQEKVVQPVGGDATVPVDVRVVAATNADLDGMVARGLFREDLLRRLNAVVLALPPLRERPEDIPLLARHFLGEHAPTPSAPAASDTTAWASDAALDALRAWSWPGNVRELANVMARAAAESGGGRVEVHHLGPLAPGERRAVPTLTTANDDGWTRREPYSTDRNLCHRIAAVTLRLAPLRERPPTAIRNALFTLLDGHAIRVEAVRALERYPWWGNWTELEAAVSALRANVPGVIDRDALERTLPHLLRAGQEPIRVLLHPSAGASGLSGFQQDFHDEALIVGRVASLADAARVAVEDPSLYTRLEGVRAQLRGAAPACLDLGQLPQLSRLHWLVTREAEGLRVSVVPGSHLPVWAGALDRELQRLLPGQSALLGRAGEVQVRTTEGAPPYVHMFLFAGAVAQEEHADLALRRLVRGRPLPGRTIEVGAMPAAPVREEEPRLTVWELDGGESAWLSHVAAGFGGTDFKAALEAAIHAAAGDAALARITRYLTCARPTQYAGRLYEHPSNEELRRRTAALLRDLSDPDIQLDRLPTAIRRAVEAAM